MHQWLESHPVYDWLVAAYQNTHRSARQIEPFIKKHHIDMTEFEPVVYRSFAEFFDREFRPGVRTFPQAADEMGAFAEARYFGWERLEDDQEFPLKGHSLSARRILGNEERARPFIGGPIILARLSPMDYHHVHYPDDGITLDQERLGYRLWTVNWHALLNKQDILFSNERQINILETRNFGRLAFVEVGALSVGRIVQVHPLDTHSSAGRKSRSLNSAVPQLLCLANQECGAHPMTYLSTRKIVSRLSCGLASPWASGLSRTSGRSATDRCRSSQRHPLFRNATPRLDQLPTAPYTLFHQQA